jgi:signal transduction histidine kinase
MSDLALAALLVVVTVASFAMLVAHVRRRAHDDYEAIVNGSRTPGPTPPHVSRSTFARTLAEELGRLEAKRARHADEAIAAGAEVRDARSLRSQLVAHASHDLRSPLNAILGFAEALLGDPFTSMSGEQRQNLLEIRNAAADLERLVALILDSARFDAGKLPLVGEPVPVVELVTHTLEQLRDLGAATRVDVALVPGLPTVWVDRPRLVRSFAALVAHALEAGSTARFLARLEFEGTRPMVVLTLEMSTGVDPKRYAQLVEGSAGLGSGARPRLASAAIALGQARGLLALSGGSLECVSGDGGEPSFRFRLPVKPPDERRERSHPDRT